VSGGAYVLGVGIHPFGRFPDLDYRALGEAALRDALDDAGVGFGDVQGVFIGNVFEGMAKASNVLERVGLTGVPAIAVENACASGGSAFALATRFVAAGAYDVLVALGVEKAPRGFIAESGYHTWQIETGLGVNPVYFALQAHRCMTEWGITVEQLADVSVKNHAAGALNPNAMYREAMTREEVLGSKMVCEPLRLYMLCAPNDGAAAAVIVSEVEARRRGSNRAVRVRASSLASRMPGQLFIPAASEMQWDGFRPSTAHAARLAYDEAGIGPADVDVFEVQDTDSASELVAYEDLGICEPGEAGALLDSGATALGGSRPVNPSGGLLSKGEPLGASALGQVHELVLQLRGEAGSRQVDGARVGLAHVVGAGGNCSVTILSR
jgi:acetyl-CoA acetyltransferase